MFETLFQFLFEYRPDVFRQGDFRFAPPAGAPVAAVVVIAALAIAFVSYRVLRSQSPQMVRQEIWALLLTDYAIRALMYEATDPERLDPLRMSFIRTLRIVRRHVTGQAGFSP